MYCGLPAQLLQRVRSRNYRVKNGLLLFFGLITLSCSKSGNTSLDTTPYNFEIPTYVTSYEGSINDAASITKEKVELGRKLFFGTFLSENNSMSCASCHRQSNGFSDPSRFSPGTQGLLSDRHAMSISYLAWDSAFFWDGTSNSLAAQALLPVEHEKELNTTWEEVISRFEDDRELTDAYQRSFGYKEVGKEELVEAIAAFESTIMGFNAPFDKWFYEGDQSAISESAIRGSMLFFDKAECVHCHGGPLLTDHSFKNNGLDSVFTDIGLMSRTNSLDDKGKFKVPSLRNIGITAPYMHDGRFMTLEQVIEHYNSGVVESTTLDPDMHVYENGLGLTQQEKDDLLAYLLTFTDSSMLSNPAFSDPY